METLTIILNMIEDLSIKHSSIPFFKRVKFQLLFYITITSIGSLPFIIFENPDGLILFISIFGGIFAIVTTQKIVMAKYYLIDFCANSKEVKIKYLTFFKEHYITTSIDNVEVEIINTTRQSGFQCKLWLKVENQEFIVGNEFDWIYDEIKNIFLFLKESKQQELNENEKLIISNLTFKENL